MSGDLASLVQRLENVTNRLECLQTGGSASTSDSDTSASAASHPSILEFDDILNNSLASFLKNSDLIGGDVKTQVSLVKEAFSAQREFLIVAVKFGKPTAEELAKLLQPTGKKIGDITEFREKNRRSTFFNHLSAISESIPAIGWVSVVPTPAPYVKEMLDAGMFYSNRVLKDFKDTDPKHVAWVKSWLQVLTTLQAYIKKHHTTGVAWNPKAAPATLASSAAAGGAGKAAGPPPPGGIPPPPPPPPPPAPMPATSSGPDDSTKRAALFTQLNQGDSVTSGLKKVSDDMKTHKNPGLRKGGVVPDKPHDKGNHAGPPIAPKPGAKKPAAVKPPKTELDGNKWIVEHHTGNKNIIISETERKHTVYIFKCVDSTIQIKGKINSLVLDTCKKTALVVEDLISSLDIVNCQSVQTQVMGQVPTINIDKTDGTQIYLSKDSLATQIITAKSSEMNVLVPQESGEYSEFAIPEQFKTVYDGTRLKTGVTDSV